MTMEAMEGIRTGTSMARWKERVPNFRGRIAKTEGKKHQNYQIYKHENTQILHKI